MSETDEYILEAIRRAVWSGFYAPDEVDLLLDDLLEEGADEEMLRAAVAPEFEKKAKAELEWPETTDCDRLDEAFEAAEEAGFVAVQNAGYTMSDGLSDVHEMREEFEEPMPYYCFYHGQDGARALDGGGLMIAFGAFADTPAEKTEAGRKLVATFKDAGLAVEWNGDPETRLSLPTLDWKRRFIHEHDGEK